MRISLFSALGALVISALAVCPASAAPWKIDPAHSYVQFEVMHLGLIPYPGRFKRFTAKLDFRPENVEQSSVDVRIAVKSLETDDGLMNETLIGEQFFDERNFPEMRFTSTAITQTGEATATIDGDLTIAGRTLPIRMNAIFAGEAKDPIFGTRRIGFIARAAIDRTKWGLSAWTFFVGSEVTIRIGIEATPN